MLYSYPESSVRIKYFQDLKGIFLACSGVTSTILGEPTKIFSFKINERNDKDQDYGKIGNLKFQTRFDSKTVINKNKGHYKAAFGCSEINKMLVVVILPFSYPDQVCIYAAEEWKNFIETFFTQHLIYYLENEELKFKAEAEEEKKVDDEGEVEIQLKQQK